MFKFGDLTLERVIFEVRFHNGYLYWDNCGKILRTLSDKWPDLVMREVSPERAHLQFGEAEIDMSFSHNRMGTHQDYPKELGLYKKFTSDSYQIILDTLQISTLLRVGNRYQYILSHDDTDEVIEFLKTKGFFNISEKIRVLGKKITQPSVRFVIERDDISVGVQAGVMNRSLEISLPKPIKVDMSAFVERGISIDVDFFSTKIVERGTFGVEEFITTQEKNAGKVIEKLFV